MGKNNASAITCINKIRSTCKDRGRKSSPRNKSYIKFDRAYVVMATRAGRSHEDRVNQASDQNTKITKRCSLRLELKKLNQRMFIYNIKYHEH